MSARWTLCIERGGNVNVVHQSVTMCCCGVIVVAQPGGTLLFHKELSPNFGLPPPDGTAQQRRWEPWSLGALLSSLQVYALGVATANMKTDPGPEAVSAPPSMSSISFANCRILFWLHNRVAGNQGVLTAVLFQKSTTTLAGASVFTRAVSEAFAEHVRGQALHRPVRGFNAVLRRKMDDHLSDLIQLAIHSMLARIQGGGIQQISSDGTSAGSEEPAVISVLVRDFSGPTSNHGSHLNDDTTAGKRRVHAKPPEPDVSGQSDHDVVFASKLSASLAFPAQ